MAVSKTTNGGASWLRYALDTLGYVFALAVDPMNSNVVYVGGTPRMCKTIDGGGHWSDVSVGITDTIFDIAINGSNSDVIYAASPAGVFKTTNGGVNWFNTGCTDVTSLVIDPYEPTTVYAGTKNGVYTSTDAGGSWVQMNSGLSDTNVTSLGINQGVYLYCGTENNGMYRWSLEVGVSEKRKELDEKMVFFVSPNPVRGRVNISYQLTDRTVVQLAVYNSVGRLVKELVNGTQNRGVYSSSWDGRDCKGRKVPGGVYFARLLVDERRSVTKFVLLE